MPKADDRAAIKDLFDRGRLSDYDLIVLSSALYSSRWDFGTKRSPYFDDFAYGRTPEVHIESYCKWGAKNRPCDAASTQKEIDRLGARIVYALLAPNEGEHFQ